MKLSRRRKVAIGLVAGAAIARAAIACGFPSPELTDLPDVVAPTTDGQLPDGAAPGDSAPPTDGALLPEVAPFDGSVAPLDAQMLDGDATVVLGDGAVINCDEDGDRFAKPGGHCGGLDCDDRDPRVRPDRTFNEEDAAVGDGGPGTNGDWNCNGVVEREFDVNVSTGCPNLLSLGCAREGWEGVPRCGSTAKFVKCVPTFLGCKAETDMRVVRCK